MSINTEQVHIDGKYHAVPSEVADEIASLRARLERAKSLIQESNTSLELGDIDFEDYVGRMDSVLRELESEGGER